MPLHEENSHPIDVFVGSQVRLRRKYLGLSQEKLASAINLTFQQVQKYERGTNRISASKLFEIARVLQVPIESFFEGATPQASAGTDVAIATTSADQFPVTSEGIELAKAFHRIKSSAVRRQVLTFVSSLGEAAPT